jgi:MerR family transcriptional regulator, thiopeptide resistance regulator
MDAKREFGTTNGASREHRWKVGELANRTGLSVRALHHYEEIGLLVPSGRTEAGHRIYGEGEVLRLQQIVSLRALGLSLDEIRRCLDVEGYSPLRVIELHIARLRERIESERKLCGHLEGVARLLSARESSSGEVPMERLVETVMEVSKMSENIEKYYTPEQLEQLERRKQELGEERIRGVEAEWPRLIEQVEAEMEAGTDPADERVQELARRWTELVKEFTGGDPGIRRSLGNLWQQEESVASIDTGHMRRLMDYVGRANATSSQGHQ